MSILDISILKKQSLRYLLYSMFLLLFALVYESFSHGVYSFYMIFSFVIPLIFGSLLTLVCVIIKRPNSITNLFYNCSIITLSLGSIVKGVLDIYGTTNKLVIVYSIIGFGLLGLSILAHIIRLFIQEK